MNSNNPYGWYVGRKEIVKLCTKLQICTSWRSVLRRKQAGTLLIRYTPEGKPFVIESEILRQKLKQADAVKNHPSSPYRRP